MDYCVSISPPSAFGYFGKFVTSNQISQSYWTTPDHVSVETRSHFDSTHGSCLEQKVGFHMDTDYSGSGGTTPAPWIDHPTFRVMHNEIYGDIIETALGLPLASPTWTKSSVWLTPSIHMLNTTMASGKLNYITQDIRSWMK